MGWRVDDWAGVLGGGRRIRWTGRASGRAVQGLGDRVWVGWDVGLVEYQCEGGRKGIAKRLVHLRMKQIYLSNDSRSTMLPRFKSLQRIPREAAATWTSTLRRPCRPSVLGEYPQTQQSHIRWIPRHGPADQREISVWWKV